VIINRNHPTAAAAGLPRSSYYLSSHRDQNKTLAKNNNHNNNNHNNNTKQTNKQINNKTTISETPPAHFFSF